MLLSMSTIYLSVTLFMLFLLSGLIIPNLVIASTHHNHLFGRTLPVTKNPLTPPNQAPITALTRAQIAAGLELPKNLIVATCPPQSTGGGTGCPPVVGTNGDDLIIAAAVQDASVYGIAGNDVYTMWTR